MARLLLIEDDESLREVLAIALAAAGHTVTQAADGRQALTFPDIDLVITDLIMSGREGLETITALHRARPTLPIIAISGATRSSNLYLKTAAHLGARRTLTKPFTPAALLQVINELLSLSFDPPASSQ